MSESNMVDKISEAFSNTIKKTNIFEKFVEIKQICSSLLIFTTITGATLLFYNEYCRCGIESIENKSSCIEYDIVILKKKMEKIIETNKIFYQILIKNNNLLNKSIENQLLYICKLNNSEVENFKNNELNGIENDIKNIIEDSTNYDEIINDCYDNMPCNNTNKVTGLNKIFNWN